MSPKLLRVPGWRDHLSTHGPTVFPKREVQRWPLSLSGLFSQLRSLVLLPRGSGKLCVSPWSGRAPRRLALELASSQCPGRAGWGPQQEALSRLWLKCQFCCIYVVCHLEELQLDVCCIFLLLIFYFYDIFLFFPVHFHSCSCLLSRLCTLPLTYYFLK